MTVLVDMQSDVLRHIRSQKRKGATSSEVRGALGLKGTDDTGPAPRVRDIIRALLKTGKIRADGTRVTSAGGSAKVYVVDHRRNKTTVAVAKPKKAAKQPVKRVKSEKKTKVQSDIVGLVLDLSGSMRSLFDPAIEMINSRAQDFVAIARESKRSAYMNITLFSRHVDRVVTNVHHNGVRPVKLSDCDSRGHTTSLHDATVMTMIDMEKEAEKRRESGEEVACLLFVVTDGMENTSSKYLNRMSEYVKEYQGKDTWSIGFMCPNGYESYLLNQGIPAGNIQPWETTEAGLRDTVSRGTQSAAHKYSRARAQGKTSIQDLFVDLSNVKAKDLRKLDNVSTNYQAWKVEKEAEISDFVNDKLSSGIVSRKIGTRRYVAGYGFYELTKKEKIQDYKEILVLDKDSKRLVGGKQARELIGLTAGSDARVNPHNLSKFQVFVQSSSSNRKLVRGTTMLYKKT